LPCAPRLHVMDVILTASGCFSKGGQTLHPWRMPASVFASVVFLKVQELAPDGAGPRAIHWFQVLLTQPVRATLRLMPKYIAAVRIAPINTHQRAVMSTRSRCIAAPKIGEGVSPDRSG